MSRDSNDPNKDYSKIIEELQSHRREIEKLHIDLANLAPSAQTNQGFLLNIIDICANTDVYAVISLQ